MTDHACLGGSGPNGSTIIDSNNANNNQAKAKITLAGSWKSSAGTPGYYGTMALEDLAITKHAPKGLART